MPVQKTRIKTLSFDLDDTLWDCKAVISKAVEINIEFMSQFSPKIKEKYGQPQKMLMLIRKTSEDNGGKVTNFTELRRMALHSIAKEFDLDPEQFVEPSLANFIHHRSAGELFPGVAEMLKRLKDKGYIIGVITNGNADVSRVPGLREVVSFHISPDHAGVSKPHPEIFNHAIKLVDCDPEHMLHIGDCPDADVKGAKEFGAHTIWVHRGKHNEEHAQHAHHCVENVLDIEAILDQFYEPYTAANM
eukprot:Clim_evm21s88 gene=Clim_evmTU21s88